MPSNYVGNPTATQSPGPQPGVGNYPIVSIPADGDAVNAASVAQGYKELSDFIAYQQTSPMVLGSTYVLSEDFDSTTLNARFTMITGTGTLVLNDAAAGGIGAVKLVTTSGSLSAMNTAATFPAITGDVLINIRVRFPNAIASGEVQQILLTNAAAVSYLRLGFVSSVNSGNWTLGINSILVNGVHDLGTAPSSVYQLITISRLSNVLYIYIDGSLKYSGAYSSSIDVGQLQFYCLDNSSGSAEMRVDYLKMYISR